MYHGLRRKHVDAYLDEFVFRYNRHFHRHVSFETVLGLPRTARRNPTATSSVTARPTKRSFVRSHYLSRQSRNQTGWSRLRSPE
jgi:hypothetical protein